MKYTYSIPVLVSTALLLVSCGGSGSSEDNDRGDDDDNTFTPINPGSPSEGRLLASQCAQCHGTDGISKTRIDSLAGEGGEILEELVEMQNENRNEVMHLQAKGYSYSQIVAIANYYNSLRKSSNNNNEGDD